MSAPLISTRSSFFASRLHRITDILLLLSAASFIFAPFAPRMSTPQDNKVLFVTVIRIITSTVVHSNVLNRASSKCGRETESMAVRTDQARSGSAMLRGARCPRDGPFFFLSCRCYRGDAGDAIRGRFGVEGGADMTPSCGN